MSAPLRIRPPARLGPTGGSDELKSYLDRLVKLIPAEVLSLYLTGYGLIPKDRLVPSSVWALVCLVFVAVVKAYGTSDRVHAVPADRVHVAISMVAFVIWVYSLGGPFILLGVYEAYIASLLILGFTFISAYIYRGQPDTGPQGR
jgi:hypothetical protein